MNTPKITFFSSEDTFSADFSPERLSETEIIPRLIKDISQMFPLPKNAVEENHFFLIPTPFMSALEALYQKSVRARGILDKVSEAVIILDASDEVRWHNLYAEKLFQRPSREIIGTDIYNLFDNRRFLESTLTPTSDARERKTTIHAKLQDTPRQQSASRRYLEMEVSPWPQVADGPQDFLLVTIRDITPLQTQMLKIQSLHREGNNLVELEPSDLKKNLSQKQQEDLLSDGILQTARKLLEYEMLELRVVNPNTKELELRVDYGMKEEIKKRVVKIAEYGYGIIGYVASTKKSYLCRDSLHDSRYLSGGINSRSSLTVPVIFQNTLLGVLNVESTQPDAFTKTDQMYMEIFARDIAVALNTYRLIEEEHKRVTQVTIEEMHRQIALPVKKILDATLKLQPLIDEHSASAQRYLIEAIKEANNLMELVHRVGAELSLTDAIPANLESVVSERNRVLYVDGTSRFRDEIYNILMANNLEVHHTVSGKKALANLHDAFNNEEMYYAILLAIDGIQDYSDCTDFMNEVKTIYAGANIIAPLVLLQKGKVDNLQSILRYAEEYFPDSRRVVYPVDEDSLVEAIKTVSGELFGKRALLVGGSLENTAQLNMILQRRGCELQTASTGKHALELIRHANASKNPYCLLIICALEISDYKRKTLFIDDVVSCYEDKTPPLIMARKMGFYDGDHVFTKVKEKLMYSGVVGTPFTEPVLLDAIRKLARNMQKLREERAASPEIAAADGDD